MTNTDTVVLSFPRDSRYYSLARLVVGGMAAPLQMSFDALDDLQLAISSMLDHDQLELSDKANDVELRLEVSSGQLVATIGSFAAGSAKGSLGTDSAVTESDDFGLKRLLNTIVDSIVVDEQDTGEWVTLIKNVKATV